MISEEEFESIKDGAENPQDLAVESCIISSDELMEAVEAAIRMVDEFESNGNADNSSWAKALGIQSDLNLNLKELTLLSMKMVKLRPAINLLAEVLAMNIPIDAISITQTKGETAMPNYRAAARMFWVQMRNRVSEPIAIQKEIHEQRKVSDQVLLAKLVPIIMKSMSMPIDAAGFAAIFALMSAKMDFNAFSDDDEDTADPSG